MTKGRTKKGRATRVPLRPLDGRPLVWGPVLRPRGFFKREWPPPQMPPRNGAQPLGLSLEFEARFAAGAAIRIDQRRSQSFGHGVDDSATDAGAFRRTIADPTDAVVRDAQPDLVGLKLAERDAA